MLQDKIYLEMMHLLFIHKIIENIVSHTPKSFVDMTDKNPI